MLRIERDEGKGRTLVFLHEERALVSQDALSHISSKNRLIHLVTQDVTSKNWLDISNAVSEIFEQKELRQVSFVCLEHASVIALHRSLDEGKFVRSLILYHPISTPHPNIATRITDWIELKLPLGLPLRTLQQGFHARSFLHRVRCPTAILLRDGASSFTTEQAISMASAIPTAWLVNMSKDESIEDKLNQVIEDMSDVPVKCPQKVLRKVEGV